MSSSTSRPFTLPVDSFGLPSTSFPKHLGSTFTLFFITWDNFHDVSYLASSNFTLLNDPDCHHPNLTCLNLFTGSTASRTVVLSSLSSSMLMSLSKCSFVQILDGSCSPRSAHSCKNSPPGIGVRFILLTLDSCLNSCEINLPHFPLVTNACAKIFCR